MMAEQGTVLVPTLSVFSWAAAEGMTDGIPDYAVQRAAGWLPGRRAMARMAADAGVILAVGSDSGGPPRGGRNAEEVVALVDAGLTPLEAISAATYGGAKALGWDGRIGAVSARQRADLVAWRTDPASDPSVMTNAVNVAFVMQSTPAKGLQQ
jgi:imidazolonepropionase-like amidohydrolase